MDALICDECPSFLAWLKAFTLLYYVLLVPHVLLR